MLNQEPTSPEENKAIVRRFYEEVLSQGNLAVADEILAPVLNFRGTPQGRDEFKSFVQRYRMVFTDFRFTIDEAIAEGDKVAVSLSITGTYPEIFKAIAPPDNRVESTGVEMLRIADGKIHQLWSSINWQRSF